MGHKGWHRRGYLPHFDAAEVAQHIIFHLHDARPSGEDGDFDDVLDRGFGASLLGDGDNALIVANALQFFAGRHYALHAWCVMPNHVHALITTLPARETGLVVKSWKTFTARRINGRLGRAGRLWAHDYFDRFMRNDAQFLTTQHYIEMNPVSAGLCENAAAWAWSSAGWRS